LAQTSSGAAYTFESVVVRSADPDLAVLKFSTTDVPHLELGSSADTVEGNTFAHEVSDQYSSYWNGPMLRGTGSEPDRCWIFKRQISA